MTDIDAADALFIAGNLDSAADAYRHIVAADPQNSAAWHGLGGACLKAGAYGEACDALHHALRLDPGHSGSWAWHGEALFNLGHVESAIDAYRRLLIDPATRAAAEQNIAVMIPGSTSADNAAVLAARRDYGQGLAANVAPMARPPRPLSGGKLRIGYVCSFFDK